MRSRAAWKMEPHVMNRTFLLLLHSSHWDTTGTVQESLAFKPTRSSEANASRKSSGNVKNHPMGNLGAVLMRVFLAVGVV